MTMQRISSHNTNVDLTARQLPFLAAWFGLLTGLGELAVFGLQKFLLHQLIWFGRHIVWMAPLANLCLFVGLGLLVALLQRFFPRLISLRNVIAVFSLLSVLSWALLIPDIKMYAATLLALGVSVQIARWVAHQSQRFFLFVRRSTVFALAGCALVIVAGLSWGRITNATVNAAPQAPNVLLIVMDTVRARNLSLYGYARQTSPHLEKLAQSGVRFDAAIATAPWTLPSHAGMFTGRLPHELSADFRTPLDATYPTLAEALSQHGWRTAGFVANTYYCTAEQGLARGFAHYEDHPLSFSELALSASLNRKLLQQDWLRRAIGYYDVVGRKSATDINRAFLHWLPSQDAHPFFAFLNYFDAHEPCLPPAPHDTQFGARIRHGDFRRTHLLRTTWRLNREQGTSQQNQADIDCYDSSIAYLDQQIGQLLRELERRGVLQNTLVIVTSDHGEAFGENYHYGHIKSAYITQLHVPLVLSLPGRVPSGQTVAPSVSLRDLPATVMDLLGLAHSFPGASLAQHWQATGEPEFTAASSAINIAPIVTPQAADKKAVIQSLVANRLHYIANPDGKKELYDLQNDPNETRDLAQAMEWYDQLEFFNRYLNQLLTE
jgi:arylsulfatase A-like enzyme